MAENQLIHSFDATFSVNGELFTTEKYRELYSAMSEGSFVSRGAGVSYPLMSAGEQIRSIVSLQFDRILDFNSNTGVVKVESGISLGKLLIFLRRNGWWLPTIPGHPSITVGGCVAVNAHGKSQYHSGLFGDSVVGLEVFHPRYGKMILGHQDQIFKLTLGGFGFTGHVLTISIQCKKLPGQSIDKASIPCANIFEAVEIITREKDKHDHVYSWNNLNLKGTSFGAGFVYCEKFSDDPSQDLEEFSELVMPPRDTAVDSLISAFLKSQVSRLYSLKEMLGPKKQKMGVLVGAFPINGKEIYHRFFGKEGLLESQIIIPQRELGTVLEKLSKAIREFDEAVALGSLKIFRGDHCYLNYVGNGVCLALNVPHSTKALSLFDKIDKICIDHQCLPNISKDSRISGDVVAATYDGFHDFKKGIINFDPDKKVQSALRARLGL